VWALACTVAMQALQSIVGWLRGGSPSGADRIDHASTPPRCKCVHKLTGNATFATRVPAAVVGAQASTTPQLGKRKAPDDEERDDEAPHAPGDGDDAATARKRPATDPPGPSSQASRPRQHEQDATAAAPGGKRKLGPSEEIQPADERSPPAASRPKARPRHEEPVAQARAEAIGSPAPSPYRLSSPKPGAAPLTQLPGYHFSRAAKSRRSSAASDVTTRSTGASGGAAAGSVAAAGGQPGPQPTYRRKLASVPSRLGGERGEEAWAEAPGGMAL
jgi:hypothetical protein